METTVGIVRYAPFNAIAIMLGANVGRPGIPVSYTHLEPISVTLVAAV